MDEYIKIDKNTFPTPYNINVGNYARGWNACINSVLQHKTADVVEVRHGYWKEIQGKVGNPFNNQVFDTIDLLVCSVCNEIFDVSEARNYCSNCGAKMDGKDGAE